jgi:D-alanyl-D-alanine dipeptidase
MTRCPQLSKSVVRRLHGGDALTTCLPMLRAVKDAAELGRLAAAGAAADAAYGEILGVPFAGRRETDVAADLAGLLRRFGHEEVDFTVVGSGPNGANPHHEAGDRVIGPGDTIVLDFGGLMDGYGSDTTRTVTVGQPSAQVQEVHDIVRRAQQAAFEAVRPGVPCEEIDRVARHLITEADGRPGPPLRSRGTSGGEAPGLPT